MNRIVRVVLLAGLASLTLGISAAHAEEHQTAPDARVASWDGNGERGDARREDGARYTEARWGEQRERREELRREELRREWLQHRRFDRDSERDWRR